MQTEAVEVSVAIDNLISRGIYKWATDNGKDPASIITIIVC